MGPYGRYLTVNPVTKIDCRAFVKELNTHLGYWYGLSIDYKEIAITLSYKHKEGDVCTYIWYYWPGWST